MQRSAAALGEFIRLGFQSAVGADAKIVIGQQAIHRRDVVGELGLPPVQFEAFYLLMGAIMVGKHGMRLRRKPRDQDEGQKQLCRPREPANDTRNERA